MKLLTSNDGFNVEINPELYAIKEFANLLESRKDKALLVKEISYIYFFYDMATDFQFETNELARNKDVIQYIGLPDDWQPDELVNEAIKAFKYLSQTVSSKLLKTAYMAINKIQEQLESINLNERDKSGKPIWNIKQIQDTINAMPMVMERIEKAEKQFIKSQEDNTKLRGTKLKSIYEDGSGTNK